MCASVTPTVLVSFVAVRAEWSPVSVMRCVGDALFRCVQVILFIVRVLLRGVRALRSIVRADCARVRVSWSIGRV